MNKLVKLRCVDNEDVEDRLTIDKEYIGKIDESTIFYEVVDNLGEEHYFISSRFNVVKEEKKVKSNKPQKRLLCHLGLVYELTEGREYVGVRDKNIDFYQVINDLGVIGTYHMNRFKLVDKPARKSTKPKKDYGNITLDKALEANGSLLIKVAVLEAELEDTNGQLADTIDYLFRTKGDLIAMILKSNHYAKTLDKFKDNPTYKPLFKELLKVDTVSRADFSKEE